MILTTLERLKNYFSKKNEFALCDFLESIDKNMKSGRHNIEGDNYANVFANLGIENDYVLESHKKYVDIHILLDGMETILFKDIQTLSSLGDYNDENDYLLYKVDKAISMCIEQGDVVIFFPSDAHKLFVEKNAAPSRKVVLKIKL